MLSLSDRSSFKPILDFLSERFKNEAKNQPSLIFRLEIPIEHGSSTLAIVLMIIMCVDTLVGWLY